MAIDHWEEYPQLLSEIQEHSYVETATNLKSPKSISIKLSVMDTRPIMSLINSVSEVPPQIKQVIPSENSVEIKLESFEPVSIGGVKRSITTLFARSSMAFKSQLESLTFSQDGYYFQSTSNGYISPFLYVTQTARSRTDTYEKVQEDAIILSHYPIIATNVFKINNLIHTKFYLSGYKLPGIHIDHFIDFVCPNCAEQINGFSRVNGYICHECNHTASLKDSSVRMYFHTYFD